MEVGVDRGGGGLNEYGSMKLHIPQTFFLMKKVRTNQCVGFRTRSDV